ncbi:MAG TPA: Rrf2 family transcriptional regulator [Pyrinomonadaceae bacterium]|jgi:Rrf2 family protein|nr:Rrf2 family transcriptional regulator [Pyrinomonadaceae bacterium]
MSTSSRFAVAVHVLTLLAWAGDEPLKSEEIACSVNTNAVVIRRILCALGRAGLVTSQTGAAGGSRLARPAREITLRDVYRAVEGQDIFALHRQPPNPKCRVGVNIEGVLGDVLAAVGGAVEQVLGEISVESIRQSIKTSSRSSSNRSSSSRRQPRRKRA